MGGSTLEIWRGEFAKVFGLLGEEGWNGVCLGLAGDDQGSSGGLHLVTRLVGFHP